jgi:hypothetical protein
LGSHGEQRVLDPDLVVFDEAHVLGDWFSEWCGSDADAWLDIAGRLGRPSLIGKAVDKRQSAALR